MVAPLKQRLRIAVSPSNNATAIEVRVTLVTAPMAVSSLMIEPVSYVTDERAAIGIQAEAESLA
jgi:hypothetical protein